MTLLVDQLLLGLWLVCNDERTFNKTLELVDLMWKESETPPKQQ